MDIYQIVMGISPKNSEDFPDHHNCRLGKWYYTGEGFECFSKLPGYRETETPHANFHTAGKTAVDCYRRNDFSGAAEALTRMEAESLDIMTQLDRIAVAGETNQAQLCHSETS